jgi:hypothetical protein
LILFVALVEKTDGRMENRKLIFPRAFAVAIDDMGWVNGSHQGQNGGQGPSRAGVDRHFNIDDYKAVVNAAQAIGTRLQGLFVLCEMDRENTCAKYPTTTMHGNDWDNSENVDDEQVQIMDFVKKSAAQLEFGMHGVGHEFWPEKMHRVRAEWYNLIDKKPWPEETLRDHFKCFREILTQYEINEENGHSFPESFAACAYSYYWNPDGDYSLGKLLNENGVKYANTAFSYIGELNPPKGKYVGGFDHGVHVLNRINYGNEWFRYETIPTVLLDNQETDIIESHFINWLTQDIAQQTCVTENWITYFKNVQGHENRYVAKNTEQLHSQWLYKEYTKVEEKESGLVIIDNTGMPDEAYSFNLLGNMVVKIKINSNEHVSSATINNRQIASYFEESGYAFLYLPPLEKAMYTLKYTMGSSGMQTYIFNDGTYNIYRFEHDKDFLSFDIKMYGSQVVMIKCPISKSFTSSNPHLKIVSDYYNEVTGILSLEISGRNICGESGTIKLSF